VKLERYLDLGRGECWLNQPSIAELAEEALRHSNGQHYELLAWVIMPNHIHVLFRVWNLPMSQVIKSWKTHIALEANKVLCRHGPFWERDYWDTYMRDEDQLLTARRYIEQNPVKAKLVLQSSHWPWSGARFRDSYGKLPPNP
jgi:REP element-mobilizing transposase RayT